VIPKKSSGGNLPYDRATATMAPHKVKNAIICAAIIENMPMAGMAFISLENVKVMAHSLAGANVERGVEVETWWAHRKQRG
jgi:hypothetical protein